MFDEQKPGEGNSKTLFIFATMDPEWEDEPSLQVVYRVGEIVLTG
jgi:hypothetical protein